MRHRQFIVFVALAVALLAGCAFLHVNAESQESLRKGWENYVKPELVAYVEADESLSDEVKAALIDQCNLLTEYLADDVGGYSVNSDYFLMISDTWRPLAARYREYVSGDASLDPDFKWASLNVVDEIDETLSTLINPDKGDEE